MKYTYPDLGERDLFISYFPLAGASGIDRVACFLQDVTERKRTEEALRESEARLRLAVQAGKMYAYEWDVATDKVVRSEECTSVLGSEDQPKQLTRQQLLASVHADDRALFVGSVDQRTPDNPTTHISYRVLRPDGSVVWFEKNARAFFDEQGRMLRMIGMVADITERKRTEEALRESEERLRLAVQAARMYAFEWDTATDAIVRSGKCADIFNWLDDPTRDTGRQFVARVHSDDREKYANAASGFTPAKSTSQIIYRVLRPDGSMIWLEESERGFFDGQGRLLKTIGIVVDITARKKTEETLSSLNRRLIEAQEQERSRIARELHDDFGQRLALLTIELEQLQQRPPNPVEIRSRIEELKVQVSEIAADIQSLSHELHTYKLDLLGVAEAMRGFCEEFGEQQRVEVDFVAHDLPSSLPQDISLCLFRVLQEALHNSAKHSGVRHFEAQLWGGQGEIHLTVRDSGAGFDIRSGAKGRGLGLISMEERLRLVDGALSVESQPKLGTTIHARVPLKQQSHSMSAGG